MQAAITYEKDITPFEKCKRLLLLTSQFHEIAIESAEKKVVEISMEAIEERNQTHVAAITLAQKATIEHN